MSDLRANCKNLSIRSAELRQDSAALVRDSNHLRRYSRELRDQLRLFNVKEFAELAKGTFGSR